MLRLAHRIMAQKSLPNVYQGAMKESGSALYGIAKQLLSSECPIIIADNVATYLNNERRTGKGKLFIDYPPMPPPFVYFFMEYNLPSTLYASPEVPPSTPQQVGYTQEGVWFISISEEDQIQGDRELVDLYGQDVVSQTQWYLTGGRFITHQKSGTPIAIAKADVLLDKEGRNLIAANRCIVHVDQDNTNDPGMAVFLMALSFLQCKTTRRVDVTKQEGPSPKWCRRMRVPEVRYQQLQINPDRKAAHSGQRKTEGDRSGKAFHIRSGHFMHFVDDGVSKGFMGKGIFGTFWVEAHAVGSMDEGEVKSTYIVNPPKEK